MVGDVDKGMMACGQVVGRIHHIPTVAEPMERVVAEAHDVKERIAQL